MAEGSRFWTTNNTGDGPSGGYSSANFVQFVRETFLTNPAAEGVLRGIGNNLAVTGASSPVAVNTGAALVYGYYYFNDSSLNVTVPTPVSATRIDRIVLRVSWAAQTVRVTRVAGTEGLGTPPALVQTPNTTWDIPLATVSITTGGVITVTDARVYVKHPGVFGWLNDSAGLTIAGVLTLTAGLAANTVKTADVQNSAITTAKIADANVTTAKIADGAITTAKIAADAVTANEIAANAVGSSELADNAVDTAAIQASAVTTAKIADANVTTAKIADSNVTAAKIAADSVDDTKAGDRVLALIRRQGGSGTDWDSPGTNNYTPTAVRAQAGSGNAVFSGSNISGALTVTFPVAFSAKPVVLVQVSNYYLIAQVTSISTTAFTVQMRHIDAAQSSSFPFHWIAFGAE